MGNPLKGEVIVKAGDEKLVLSYSTEAIYRLEKQTGLKIGAIKNVLQDDEKFSTELLRTMFWAALLDSKGVEFELDDVGPILSKVRPQAAIQGVMGAFIGAYSDPDAMVEKPASPPAPGQKKTATGSAS